MCARYAVLISGSARALQHVVKILMPHNFADLPFDVHSFDLSLVDLVFV
jgi:hypothetical protein